MLHSVLQRDRPVLPTAHDWRPKVHEELDALHHYFACPRCVDHRLYEWGEMINGKHGLPDCTIAAAGHMLQTWTANADDQEFTMPDEQIRKAYCDLTGVNLEDPNHTLPGISCVKALNFWRNSGIGKSKIHSFAGLHPGNREEIQEAIYTFGSAYVCLLLPATARQQHMIWDAVPSIQKPKWLSNQPNTWEPHAVCAVAYDEKGLTVITWGLEKQMTWEFYKKYSDEAYAVLSLDWLTRDGKNAPNHIDAARLEAQLDALSVWGALPADDREKDDRLKDVLSKFPRGRERVVELLPDLFQLAGDNPEARQRLHSFMNELGIG